MSKCSWQNLVRACGGWLLFALVLTGSSARPAHAVPDYLADFQAQYPSAAGSRIDACGLCHGTIPQLNPYGSAFRNADFSFQPIEGLDSDGDGAVNLAEIEALSFPGDPADTPAVAPSPTPTATTAPPTPTATVMPGACVGDCNENAAVTIDELLKAVNIALGTAGVDTCRAVDRNGNDGVTIDELVLAVSSALNGCTPPA